MKPEAIVSAINQYPDDRDLRKLGRQLSAAERNGGKTKSIREKIDQRLLLLQNGGLSSAESAIST